MRIMSNSAGWRSKSSHMKNELAMVQQIQTRQSRYSCIDTD